MQVREVLSAQKFWAMQVAKDNIKDVRKFIAHYAMKDTPMLDADGEPSKWRVEAHSFTLVLSVGDWVVVSDKGFVETFDTEDFETLFYTGRVSFRLDTFDIAL